MTHRCVSACRFVLFQSTLPRREWLRANDDVIIIKIISINTPTKGVTHSGFRYCGLHIYFNQHSHEGSDNITLCWNFFTFTFQSTLPRREWRAASLSISWTDLFQSTLPRREWQPEINVSSETKYFNQHSHEGSDLKRMDLIRCYLKFQSTLPRREWQFKYFCGRREVLFQSTLPRREWLFFMLLCSARCCISINTPTKGVTCDKQLCSDRGCHFNQHSHEGSDALTLSSLHASLSFQSTLPRREWLGVQTTTIVV